MNRIEFIGKLNALYVGDKNCLEELITAYDEKDKEIERLNNIINELCWKPIEEYDKGNYDWVLIKYFDGDYECVPIAAERRWGKWYSENEMEIQFDVRYFFDMHQLDKLKGVDKE